MIINFILLLHINILSAGRKISQMKSANPPVPMLLFLSVVVLGSIPLLPGSPVAAAEHFAFVGADGPPYIADIVVVAVAFDGEDEIVDSFHANVGGSLDYDDTLEWVPGRNTSFVVGAVN